MGAWTGDWEARIAAFARREGHDSMWSYLRAHPGVTIASYAERIASDVAR